MQRNSLLIQDSGDKRQRGLAKSAVVSLKNVNGRQESLTFQFWVPSVSAPLWQYTLWRNPSVALGPLNSSQAGKFLLKDLLKVRPCSFWPPWFHLRENKNPTVGCITPSPFPQPTLSLFRWLDSCWRSTLRSAFPVVPSSTSDVIRVYRLCLAKKRSHPRRQLWCISPRSRKQDNISETRSAKNFNHMVKSKYGKLVAWHWV